MDISIVVRKNIQQWGGDVGVFKDLKIGFESMGATVEITSNISGNSKNRKYLLTNSCLDLRSVAEVIGKLNANYYILPFHEDFLGYFRRCYGFFVAVKSIVNDEKYIEDDISLDDLESNTELCEYLPIGVPMHGYSNKQVLTQAKCIFPNSIREQKTILRDAPLSKTKIVRLPTREVEKKLLGSDEQQFLKSFDLNPGYIIQVGRLEPRKNQLATILASRDIPNTLVLIATSGYNKIYEDMVIKAILKYRKYPTLIVSQNIQSTNMGLLRIRQMPNAEKLSWGMLGSAYLNASVNCHPAFYELPGLTYIESVSLGVPTLFSKMTAIDEYIEFNSQDAIVNPNDINQIKQILKNIISRPGDYVCTLKDNSFENFYKSIYLELSEGG